MLFRRRRTNRGQRPGPRHAAGSRQPATDRTTPHPDWANTRTAVYPVVRPGSAGNLTPAQAWRANRGRWR
ncbi:hypothetical protein GCM10012279_22710 [Micromonospora yangpuensis]|nr:hypothetical protein GCM10012279_22710 [Micromonospora yangpuensis]